MLAPTTPAPVKELSLQPSQLWPPYTSSLKRLKIPESGLVGLDLEYNPDTQVPYMASLAIEAKNEYGLLCFSGSFEKYSFIINALYDYPNIHLVGHNILSADIKVLQKHWKKAPPQAKLIDTLLAYYLMNQHLCHATKEEDALGNIEYKRGPGKLRLGSMASQYLPWAEYKTCRGSLCEGPCPEHQESWYNACDAGAPILAWHEMLKEAKQYPSAFYPNGIPLERNHQHLLNIQTALNNMAPLLVYLPTVQQLSNELEKKKHQILPFTETPCYHKVTGKPLKKTIIEWEYGFNPNSPSAVKQFFADRGIRLKKSSIPDIAAAIKKYDTPAYRKTSFHDLAIDALKRLLAYKKAGKGFESWFNENVLTPIPNSDWGQLDKVEWMSYGGAMGRAVSRNPNCQNFPKRGEMAVMRKAFKAPDGFKWLKFDACQGELRVFGYVGGIDPMDMGDDAFTFVLNQCGDLFYRVAEMSPIEYNKNPRDACKQMAHAYDYGEGMVLLPPGSWRHGRYKQEYDEGALLVYENWEYKDYVIGFNGINLAHRLFGDSSYPNRRKALEIQAIYAKSIAAVTRAQHQILEQSLKGYVVTPSGHLLKLYQDDRNNIKQALAQIGQCTLSAYMQEIFCIYSQKEYPPAMYIHDELGFLVPESWSKSQILDYLSDASPESKLIPGFRCPMDMKIGPTYGDLSANF